MASLGTGAPCSRRWTRRWRTGAPHQRDVAAGQSTLFDLFAMPAESGGSTLPRRRRRDRKRQRLRWEKELIGLYLSDHPLSEIENELADYATALVVDLAEEADQTKVTLGGIVASSRRVITRAGSTMLVATLEDLTGSVEVVVFPKVYEQTRLRLADDSIVLVSGRLDRRDEAPQILCEAVWSWDDATRMGVEAFGVERDRALAPRGRGSATGRRRARAIPVEAPAPSRWPSPRPSARRSPPRSPPPRPMRSRSIGAGRIGRDRGRADRGGGAERPAPRRDRVGEGRARHASGTVAGGAVDLGRRRLAPGADAGPRRVGRPPGRCVRRAAGVPVAVELRSAISVA